MEIQKFENMRYCIYLRYQNASNRKLYEMLEYLEQIYCQEFPYLNPYAGFVNEGNMYLVLKFYVREIEIKVAR